MADEPPKPAETTAEKIARLRALRLEQEEKRGLPQKKARGGKQSAAKAKSTLSEWYEQQKKFGRDT